MLTLRYNHSLKCFLPDLVRDWPLVRQLNGGTHRVKDIDAFTRQAGQHGLTVETIGSPE